MIRLLFKQDPAFRMLWVTLPASIAVALFTRVLLVDVASRMGSQNPGLQFAFLMGWLNLWGLLVLVLYKSHFWIRCSRVGLTLPIRPKTLWLTRIAALVTASMMPVILLTLTLALRIPAAGTGLSFDPLWLGRGLHVGLGVLLALGLWQMPSPEFYRAGFQRGYFAYALLVAAAVFVFVRLAPVWSVFTVVAAALSLAIGIWVYRSLPGSFVVVSRAATDREPEPPPQKTVASATEPSKGGTTAVRPARRNPRTLAAVTALRLAHNNLGGWIVLGVICLYSFLLIHGYQNGRNVGPYALFTVIWVWFTINQAIPKLHLLDHLPLSRRVLFAVAALPSLVTIVIGFGLSYIRSAATTRPDAQITYTRGELKVPPEFWELATQTDIPLIRAPWGETHQPKAYRVLPGADLAVYNPYESGKDNSTRFVMFQIDRAVKAVHGPSVRARLRGGAAGAGRQQTVLDTSNAAAPRFPIDSTTAAAIETGEMQVMESLGMPSERRLRGVLLGAILSVLLTTVLLFVTMQAYRSPGYKTIFMGTVIGVLMLFVASLVGAFFADVWRIIPPEALDALPNVLIRKAADRMPIATAGLWFAVAAVIVGGYVLIASRFDRAEILPKERQNITGDY